MKALVLILALVAIVGCGVDALASTFVGNGGTAGDVELLVTIRQIRGAAKSINTEGEVGTFVTAPTPMRITEFVKV